MQIYIGNTDLEPKKSNKLIAGGNRVNSKKKIGKERLKEIANCTRIKVVQMIGKSGFGHIGGSMSIVELLTVLYFYEMNIDPKNPQ